jgi:hypothetical protein
VPPSSHERRSEGGDQRNKENQGSSPADVHALYIRIGVGTFATGNVHCSLDSKQNKCNYRDNNSGAPEPVT